MNTSNLVIPGRSPVLNNYQPPKVAAPVSNPAMGGIFNWQNQYKNATTGLPLLQKNVGTAINQAADAGNWLSRLFSPNPGGALGNIASGNMNQPTTAASPSTPVANQPATTPAIRPTVGTKNLGPNLPAAASYAGGQAVPRPGTPEYYQAQNMHANATSTGTPPPPITGSQGGYVDSQGNYVPPGGVQTSYQPVTNPPVNTTTGYPNYTNPTNTGTPGAFQTAIQQQLGIGLGGGQQAVSPYTSVLGGLLNKPSPEVQKDIAMVSGLQQQLGNIANDPNVAANVASGRAQAFAPEVQAGETALSNALAQQAQQIQAGQAAGQLGVQAQQQGISALNNVANLPGVAPQLGQYGQTYYQYGQPTQGGDMNSMIDYWASQLASGKVGLNDVPDTITGAPNLKTQLLQATQAKNPSYNPSVSSAQQSSAADLTGQSAQIQSTLNSADASFSLMLNVAQQGGVNDLNVPILNTLKNNVARGLASDQSVTTMQSLIQGIRDQYASILGGGTATDQTRSQAAQQIPDDVSLGALQQIQQYLKAEGQNRLAGLKQQVASMTGQGGQGGQQGGYKGGFVNSAVGPIPTDY